MTRTEAIEILKDLSTLSHIGSLASEDIEAFEMAIASLETDEAYRLEYERTTEKIPVKLNITEVKKHQSDFSDLDEYKAEEKYCDRNICAKNEYNGIECEDCEVTKSQELTTKNDLGVEKIVDVLGSYTDLDIPYKREIAENILANLPSVTPQEPKTGKWISTETKGVRYAFWCRYKCSLCGELSDHTNFCPNCGADMRGEE